jgi:hypothetical protein
MYSHDRDRNRRRILMGELGENGQMTSRNVEELNRLLAGVVTE